MRSSFYITACLALIICTPLSGCKKGLKSSNQKIITLSIAHTPEVDGLMKELSQAFEQSKPMLHNGAHIVLDTKSAPILDQARKIASGKGKVHLWLSPSSSWTNFANSSVKNLGARQTECSELFATPIVVATTAQNLEKFAAKKREFSWSTLESPLFFNHGSPSTSATGLASVIQMSYLVSKVEGELKAKTLAQTDFEESIKKYEQKSVGYGDNELMLLNKVIVAPMNRLHYSLTTEQMVAFYNYQRSQTKSNPIIALYPEEGSYWMDYSLCISDAGWVSPAHKVAITKLKTFLQQPEQQKAAMRWGFRPSQASLEATAPLTKEYGVSTDKGKRGFLPVRGETVRTILNRWQKWYRPNAVMLVLDTSGSTSGAKIRVGKDLFRTILATLGDDDLKGLITFASEPTVASEFIKDAALIIPKLDQFRGAGGSALYDAIDKAFTLAQDPALKGHRRSILLFTDGEDKNSRRNLNSLISRIENLSSQYNIDLNIIAIGHEADFTDLQKIVKSAYGSYMEGGPDQIRSRFNRIIGAIQ